MSWIEVKSGERLTVNVDVAVTITLWLVPTRLAVIVCCPSVRPSKVCDVDVPVTAVPLSIENEILPSVPTVKLSTSTVAFTVEE